MAQLVGTTNSIHCCLLFQELADFTIEDEILNSHDVVSLFTNTPIDKALEVIGDRLEKDSQWMEITQLNVDDIIILLEFTLATTYFRFRGVVYRQAFGTAMWEPGVCISCRLIHGIFGGDSSGSSTCKDELTFARTCH